MHPRLIKITLNIFLMTLVVMLLALRTVGADGAQASAGNGSSAAESDEEARLSKLLPDIDRQLREIKKRYTDALKLRYAADPEHQTRVLDLFDRHGWPVGEALERVAFDHSGPELKEGKQWLALDPDRYRIELLAIEAMYRLGEEAIFALSMAGNLFRDFLLKPREDGFPGVVAGGRFENLGEELRVEFLISALSVLVEARWQATETSRGTSNAQSMLVMLGADEQSSNDEAAIQERLDLLEAHHPAEQTAQAASSLAEFRDEDRSVLRGALGAVVESFELDQFRDFWKNGANGFRLAVTAAEAKLHVFVNVIA